MILTGTIKSIFDTQQVTASFKKREFVLEIADNPEYPELIKIEFIQDKCSVLDSYAVGQPVEVSINLKGRAWTGNDGVTKYFNTIQAWKIESKGDRPAQPTTEEETDDLPF